MVRLHEGLGVLGMHDRVANEQAAEQEHLGDQEEPHADLRSIELLPHPLEMVLQERRMFRFGVDGRYCFTHRNFLSTITSQAIGFLQPWCLSTPSGTRTGR